MALVNKLTYHKRLFLFLLVFSWTLVGCFTLFQYSREKDFKSENLNSQLQIYNRHLLESIHDGESCADFLQDHTLPFEDLRITIIRFDGEVIYDNQVDAHTLDSHLGRPEVADAIDIGGAYRIGRKSATDGKQYFYCATKGEELIARSAIPYSSSLRELLKADLAFLWVIVAISLAMSIVGYFATRSLGKNIERLNRFAEKARKGESFDEEESFPNDELGSISRHIVQLYSQWQHTIADRDQEHSAALKQEQDKIRIKKQLTNNINHELKTPVAAMNVCLETLLSGIELSDEKRIELLERCYSNNLRLRRLLEDVSSITRLEDGGQMIIKEALSINDILNEMIDEFSIQQEKDGIQLHIDFPEQVIIDGNLSLISSIFRNLAENAIAYSEGQNIYINLLENTDEHCKISFEDDGVGVEEKHLDRLFERFYRVDKGRSRQKGGTGLGLAIVKHSILFHGGHITAYNRPSGGLGFIFVLQK